MADSKNNVEISVDLSKVESGLKALIRTATDASKRGLRDVGEELLRVARKEVPHDTGNLELHGEVDDSGLEDDRPSIAVAFNTPYAARMHEHPEYHFQKGRKAKYLADPLTANMERFAQHVAEVAKSDL